MINKKQDDPASRFIRDRVNQARTEAGDTQEDLANALNRNRVTISDIERGRVAISAHDLAMIASHYGLPISYFYPSKLSISKDELSRLDQEVVSLFWRLPDDQKYIALEYLKQIAEISSKGLKRMFSESIHEDMDE